MDRIKGIVTLNINYYIDLDSHLFNRCKNMEDVLKTLEMYIEYPIEDLADELEIKRVLYEGFDVDVDLVDEWSDRRNARFRIYG